MKPFNIKLSDADRARLEEHRAALGQRSHADVIRLWIARAPEPLQVRDIRVKPGWEIGEGAREFLAGQKDKP